MLTLIQGGFLADPGAELIPRIKQAIARGEHCFLIVPEQETLIAEWEAALALPPNAPLCFEVTNFTRLANTVFRMVGGLTADPYDSTAKALLMWRALSETMPLLSENTRTELSEGVVSRALAAVGEMKKLAIGEEALASFADSEELLTNRRLVGKLRDLSMIMKIYGELCGKDSSEDETARLCRKLAEHPSVLAGSKIFVDGFTSFTESQYKLFELLLGRADLTLTLLCPKVGADRFEFTETRTTKERLLRLANLSGVEKRLLTIDGNKKMKNDALAEISTMLWDANCKFDNYCLQKAKDSLRIFSAHTPYEEASFLASDIKKKIISGVKYNEIAIIARSCDPYLDIVDRALLGAKIPVFVSKTDDISSFEAVKLIYTAYAVITGGFRRSDVIAYMKCGLSGISRESCDEFELYAEKWQIPPRRFTDGELWNMNPDGYTGKIRPESEEKLLRINRTREQTVSLLLRFSEAANKKQSVRYHAEALVDFLISLSVEEQLAVRAELLTQRGEITAAEENSRLWRIIIDILDKTVETLGDFEIDAHGFVSLLRIALGSVSIGRLPTHTDEVIFGGANMLRLSGKKHVYLIGVNAGEFPANAQDPSYFSEKERTLLSSLGLATEPTNDIRCAKELFYFSRAFSEASETVTLLYSEKNLAFKNTPPADVIRHLSDASGGVLAPIPVDSLPPEEQIYTTGSGIDALALSLRDETKLAIRAALIDAGHGFDVRMSEGELYNANLSLSPDCANMLYPSDSLALTQSRIDKFLSCPLSHFLRYVLKLDQNRKAEFDAMNIGTMVHALLEEFFRGAKERGERLSDITHDEIVTRVRSLASDYVTKIGASGDNIEARRAHAIDRLTGASITVVEGLCEELRDSAFTPAFFELKIERGKKDAPAPTKTTIPDGTDVFVYGTIDRTDTYLDDGDAFVRVVDYKTGSKDFSPKDLLTGQNLQMFLYLRAVTETPGFRAKLGVAPDGEVIPAGVIYVGTKLDDAPVATPNEDAAGKLKAAQKRQGMVLDDPRALNAMNSEYLPFSRTKAGTPKKGQEDRLFTREGWREICHLLDREVARVATSMKSGKIPASPLHDRKHTAVCDNCEYRAVCRNAK